MLKNIVERILLGDEIVYIVAKHFAESDSIGEGYSYCREYTKDNFNDKSDEVFQDYREAALNCLMEVVSNLTR